MAHLGINSESFDGRLIIGCIYLSTVRDYLHKQIIFTTSRPHEILAKSTPNDGWLGACTVHASADTRSRKILSHRIMLLGPPHLLHWKEPVLKAVGSGNDIVDAHRTSKPLKGSFYFRWVWVVGENPYLTRTFGPYYTCLHLFNSLGMLSIAPPLLSRGKSSRQGEFSMTRDHSTLSPPFGPRTPRSTTRNFHLKTRYRYRLMTSTQQ